MRQAATYELTAGRRDKAPRRRRLVLLSSVVALAAACMAMPAQAAEKSHGADKAQIARGKYLVTLGSCTDCHTPGHFLGHEDTSRFLGGSDVGFGIPHLGVFVGPNLTPDKATGLGNWTTEQIVTALTKGVTPDGRKLAPVMPSDHYATLTKPDVLAIAAYLQSLPPVSHQVAGPFGPSQTPTTFVMTVVPGDVYGRLVNPPPPPPPPAPAAPAPAQMAPPSPAQMAPPPTAPAAK
jgi:Cytochrome c